jgi:hypothetical protein
MLPFSSSSPPRYNGGTPFSEDKNMEFVDPKDIHPGKIEHGQSDPEGASITRAKVEAGAIKERRGTP